MKTVILCGGQGNRLREETEFRPKPLIEIGESSILTHIMATYMKHGYNDFILPLGYKGDMIREYFRNFRENSGDTKMDFRDNGDVTTCYSEFIPFSVTLMNTGLDTLTGGRVRRAFRYIRGDNCNSFMVTYGDGLANIDINKLVDFHNRHGKLATISVGKSRSRFGIVEFDVTNRVTQFSEKPENGWTNIGFMVFEKEVIDYLDGDMDSLEGDFMENLVKDNQLMAYKHDGFFHQMDTYRDYLHLNELWRTGNVPWR